MSQIEGRMLTHMFWAYGDLTNLERICINSFVQQRYQVNLWTYGDIKNAPAGVCLKDAREILPENRVFLWQGKSYACFADLFRYAVLREFGGLYADTDIIAIVGPESLSHQSFLVTERSDGLVRSLFRSLLTYLIGAKRPRINNNLIYSARPKTGDIIDLAYAFSDRYPVEKMNWGDIGPNLLTILANEYPTIAFEVKEPEFANSIDWWNCPDKLLKPEVTLSKKAAFLHCYSGMWGAVNKNCPFPKHSLMAGFAEKYL